MLTDFGPSAHHSLLASHSPQPDSAHPACSFKAYLRTFNRSKKCEFAEQEKDSSNQAEVGRAERDKEQNQGLPVARRGGRRRTASSKQQKSNPAFLTGTAVSVEQGRLE